MTARAPIRICDNGGWTDTWFAGHGKVFNIAVSPGVEVAINTFPVGTVGDRVRVDLHDLDERYGFELGDPPGRHRLLEAVVDVIGVPDGDSLEISIRSVVPPGSSTGTSAAVTVALVAALSALQSRFPAAEDIARTAHRIEVERLGIEGGIQDQLCAAHGGINFIEIPAYPTAVVTQLSIREEFRQELERRLVLVYLGSAHESAALHDRVIERVGRDGGSPHLDTLRHAAEISRDAVVAEDLRVLGRAMRENTEAQRLLHPDLVSTTAQRVIDVAALHGAVGWKVNGAGGDGGSMTLLCGTDVESRGLLISAVSELSEKFEILPVSIARRGVQISERAVSAP